MDRFAKVAHELSCFLETWPFQSIVEKRGDERMTREDLNHRLIGKIHADPLFKSQFLAHPRFVFAIAIEESLGIDRYDFVRGIGRVEVLQETRRQLYLILPACHRGCKQEEVCGPPEGACAGSCHVCGQTFPKPGACFEQAGPSSGANISRQEIEAQMTKRAGMDSSFKQALRARPMETYSAFAQMLCGGHLPEYLQTVENICVLEEDLEEVYFRLPVCA